MRRKATYSLFKTTLRLMLLNIGVPKKEELLDKFKKNYRIKLPKNFKKIISNKILNDDVKNVLKFSEDCLNYLIK